MSLTEEVAKTAIQSTTSILNPISKNPLYFIIFICVIILGSLVFYQNYTSHNDMNVNNEILIQDLAERKKSNEIMQKFIDNQQKQIELLEKIKEYLKYGKSYRE